MGSDSGSLTANILTCSRKSLKREIKKQLLTPEIDQKTCLGILKWNRNRTHNYPLNGLIVWDLSRTRLTARSRTIDHHPPWTSSGHWWLLSIGIESRRLSYPQNHNSSFMASDLDPTTLSIQTTPFLAFPIEQHNTRPMFWKKVSGVVDFSIRNPRNYQTH